VLGREARPRRIAFVILTWNSEAHIERCLGSILAFRDIDVLTYVVDNGSSDRTLAILQRFEPDPRLSVFKQRKNLGTTVSRNIALRRVPSDVEYVCVLDSDTRVNEAAFAAMIDALERNPGVGLVGPIMCSSAGATQLSGRNLPSVGIKLRKACPLAPVAEKGAAMEIPRAPVIDGLQQVEYLLSACWFMPRRVLEEVGFLDEAIFYAPEDVDYCVRVQKAGYRVALCHEVEIVHEYQRLSKRKLLSKLNLEHLKGLAYYFAKHGYLFNPKRALGR